MRRLVLLAVLLLLAVPAEATHQGHYALNPVEHDDQGRSDEPDFAATSVLGPALANRVLDLDGDGVATPDRELPPPHGTSTVLAPGCTDGDHGRRPSGLCGLWTVGAGVDGERLVPPGILGLPGSASSPPPGAYTPTRSTVVRFLDVRADAQVQPGITGVFRLDLNHKVADAGLRGALPATVAGPSGWWAWLGDWQDRNANGVIDHLGDERGGTDPANEFVWHGACLSSSGEPGAGPHCVVDPPPRDLVLYAFPGHHTASCGFSTMSRCLLPGDLPGRRVLDDVLLGFGDESYYGDPLLGEQTGVAPDGTFWDLTGNPALSGRGWTYGYGLSSWYYDQSLVVGHIAVAAYGAPSLPGQVGYALDQARFLDVDHHRTLSPDLGRLVQSQAKPAVRNGWVVLRDGAPQAAEQAGRSAALAVGPLDDLAWDPGWSHEPNTAEDQFPGALFRVHPPPGQGEGKANHLGWRNDYAAHATGVHAWADVQTFREIHYGRALDTSAGCVVCVAGPSVDTTASPEPREGTQVPRAQGDHGRSLGPGVHHVVGVFGRWRDLPQLAEVPVLDPFALHLRTQRFLVGPDGWVGNVLNHTGATTDAEGNLATDTCTLAGVAAAYPWGWCHPDLDGALGDANDYAWQTREWFGGCYEGPPQPVTFWPAGGRWTVPVFLWRDHERIDLPAGPRLEDVTGSTAPIVVRTRCHAAVTGGLLGIDALVLPLGNAGLEVRTSFEALVTVEKVGKERVVDVDVYEAMGLGELP